MSMYYYAKKKEPRMVYDEFEIGHTSNGKFNKVWADIGDETNLFFNTIDDLIEFVEKTDRYIFINECDEEISKEEMIKIITK